jgi:hypothetical protein
MKKPAPDVPPAPYRMPAVEKGQWVLWWDAADREGEPYPALVTEVSADCVTVQVYESVLSGCRGKDGVHHAADPRKQLMAEIGTGVWDFTPQHYALQALLSEHRQALAALAERLALLEAALTAPAKK